MDGEREKGSARRGLRMGKGETNLDVEAGGDDTGLVDAAVELDDDLARAVVVLVEKRRVSSGLVCSAKSQQLTISSNSSM